MDDNCLQASHDLSMPLGTAIQREWTGVRTFEDCALGWQTLKHRPCSLRFATDENDSPKCRKQVQKFIQMMRRRVDVCVRDRADPFADADVPRHHVPGDGAHARQTSFFIQEEEILRRFIWIIPRDKSGANGSTSRRFKQEKTLGKNSAIHRVELGHSFRVPRSLPEALHECRKRRNVRLT
jgi:hypothetical protein